MAEKRRGFFARILNRIFQRRQIVKSSYPQGSLRQRAFDNIIRQLALVNTDTVNTGITSMTPDELAWTADATADDLQQKARLGSDRVTPDFIPVNPWWYR